MSSIGIKIKKLREQKNVSQEDLAYHLDISQSSLSRIESGSVEKVDFMFMQKVCDYFRVDAGYFLENETVINEVQNNHGVVYNKGIFNSVPEDLLKSVVTNQEQITQLITAQNKLIEGLLKK